MATEEFQSPQNPKNGVNRDTIISPRFRSVAAMAGWDEEAILLASLVVEDTPERESSKRQKRINLQSKSPQTNSRRKRRIQRSSPLSNPVSVLNLDDNDVEARVPGRAGPVAGKEPQIESLKKKTQEDKGCAEPKSEKEPPANLPCLDKLREELSCAICLEICFEPSTTPCGHSFCKKCLKSAADKCGKKCPKCRQLIGIGRSCIVNTSLWNTIQLLFPQEVEARKAVAAKNSREEVTYQSTVREDFSSRARSGRTNSMAVTNQSTVSVSSSTRARSGRTNFVGMNRGDSVRVSSSTTVRVRRATPSQAEDAALAWRLQREEFMVAFRATDEPQPQVPAEAPPVSNARANLRAMASRAIDIRLRRRLT